MIKIVIVSFVRLYREGLRSLLQEPGKIEIVGVAEDRHRAIDLLRDLEPDVILVDTSGPQGLVTLRGITAQANRTRAVALGVQEIAEEVVACAEAGACGYVSREADSEQLRTAIHGAVQRELHCTPQIARALLRRVGELAGDSGQRRTYRLSARELEVTRLIDRGLSNKEIASGLSIELSTVKNHVHNILHKLHVRRRWQAAERLRSGEIYEPRSFATRSRPASVHVEG
ncbi:MAG: response regulator transcription factor [Deltaproteobacteria bacterium]|nr:response regulator transcription factor [Deltaproteobacteria bacterium]